MHRRSIILKNISLSLVYKTLSMAIVFITIPILLNYLGNEQYGVWAVIFSIVNILLYVEGTIGNALKTKLSEALSNNDLSLAKEYISIAYVILFFLTSIILLSISFFIFKLDLQQIFNTTIEERELKQAVFSLLVLICIGLFLGLYKAIYYAINQASKVELAMLVYQVIILVSIIIISTFFEKSLSKISLTYGFASVLTAVFFTIKFYKNRLRLIPSIIVFNWMKAKKLLELSTGFFVIQLSMIIIFTLDNLIITRLMGPAHVTNYDITLKIFQVLIMLSLIIQEPLWALYTEAFQKRDFKWIKKTIKNLNRAFVLFASFIILMFFISDELIIIWTRKDLMIAQMLIAFMCIFTALRVYSSIYMTFLNSIGAIKLQVYLFALGAVIKIPFSIYLVKNTSLGSSGIIIASCISIIMLAIFLPIQTSKILNKRKPENVQNGKKAKYIRA
jgi:O-antigen/teichoic acid export membrane protein